MTKDEALKQWADDVSKAYDILAFGHTERAVEILAKTRNAMREALAQPAPVQEPVQDSTCNETLRGQGKAYPRTCKKCGLGPCIGKPKFDTTPPQRTWAGLMRGVRVDGDTVIITVKGGNDAARELCGALLMEKNT